MRCPRCDFLQADGSIECPRCGVIFSKLGTTDRHSQKSVPTGSHRSTPTDTAQHRPGKQPELGRSTSRHSPSGPPVHSKALETYESSPVVGLVAEEAAPEPRVMDGTDWLVLASGAGIAALAFVSPLVNNTLWTMTTLVHEMGHSLAGWLFGMPSVPAFDLMYGGGITLSRERSVLLLVVIYSFLGWLIYYYRRNTGTVIALIALGVVHLACSLTQWHQVVYLFMGHGTELIIAGLFIYRALSGSAVVHFAERPLYAAIGFFIVYQGTTFAYRLMTSPLARIDYGDAKGGGHWMDFSRIAGDHLGTRLETVALFFFVCCLLPLALGYLSFRYQEHIHGFLARLLIREAD